MNTTNHLICLLKNNDTKALNRFFIHTDYWENEIQIDHWENNIDFQDIFDFCLKHINPNTQNILGYMYQHDGVEQDYQKAIHYYQLAADQGYAVAQNNLGYMYHYDHGIEQDYQKAVNYYQLAEDQRCTDAQNN